MCSVHQTGTGRPTLCKHHMPKLHDQQSFVDTNCRNQLLFMLTAGSPCAWCPHNLSSHCVLVRREPLQLSTPCHCPSMQWVPACAGGAHRRAFPPASTASSTINYLRSQSHQWYHSRTSAVSTPSHSPDFFT